jgi:hypothetical protein
MTRTTLIPRLAALVASLLIAACGGGGSDGAVATDIVPAAASVSPASFTQYAGSLPTSESAEPLALGALMPPTADTSEPSAL